MSVKNTIHVLVFIFSTSSISQGSEFYWMKTTPKALKRSQRKIFFEGKLKEEIFFLLDSINQKKPNEYFFFFNENELQSYVSCGFDLYAIQDEFIKLKYTILTMDIPVIHPHLYGMQVII